jgi:hypothetical protein
MFTFCATVLALAKMGVDPLFEFLEIDRWK